MPKLNVQQTNQNVIQAFKNALAIGNLKGIIASDGNHNFSTAGSNRNLTDNSWFTVRQRGNGPFTGTSIHSADRWKSTGGNPTVNLLSPYGIQLVNTTNSNVDQYLSYTKEDLDGKTVTLSVLSDDGITSGTGTFDASSNSYTITFTFGSGKWYCRFGYFSSVHARPFIRIANVTANKSTSVNIYAIKLEPGSVSTLANDVPPNFVQELKKCQYYFKRFSPTSYTALWSGIAVNQTMGGFFVEGEMRDVRPVVTVSGTGYMAQEGSMKLITSGEAYYTRQGSRLLFTTSATLTNNKPVTVYTSANQNFVVDISADL